MRLFDKKTLSLLVNCGLPVPSALSRDTLFRFWRLTIESKSTLK